MQIYIALSVLYLGAHSNAQDLINKANEAQYYAGRDGRAQVKLRIVDRQGRKSTRELVIARRDAEEGGRQHFLVRFNRPADIRNTVFMVHKKPRGDDDRWLYLPALDLVKRIAASDERTSFVGSHLFYEDISGRGPYEDEHTIVGETASEWEIESKPRNAKNVEFDRYRVKIRKEDHLPASIVYFDERDAAIRRIEAVRVEVFDGHPTITRMKVSDLRSGGYTLVGFARVKYDLDIPESVFVERSLRSPPARWLRGS